MHIEETQYSPKPMPKISAAELLEAIATIGVYDLIRLASASKGYKTSEAIACGVGVSAQNLRRLKKHNPPIWELLKKIADLPAIK
jgi:hypothetical protein